MSSIWKSPAVNNTVKLISSARYTSRLASAYFIARKNDGAPIDSIHNWEIYTVENAGVDFRDTTIAPTKIEALEYARKRFGNRAYVVSF